MKKNKHIGIIFFLIVILVFVISDYNKPINKDFSENGNIVSDENNVVVGEIAQKSGPVIEIAEKTFDLGTVVYGDVASHIFEITNRGSEDLEILKLSTSCGCTKASVADEDKIISPGESVEMLVTFDPAVHKDDSDLGELQRIIYVKTNDPSSDEVEVEITANVVK